MLTSNAPPQVVTGAGPAPASVKEEMPIDSEDDDRFVTVSTRKNIVHCYVIVTTKYGILPSRSTT